MEINYYRNPDISGNDYWKHCFIDSSSNDQLTTKPLVSINGQPILRQHQSTYLTGKETCRAHHFAMLLATAVLSGQCPNFSSAQVCDTVNVNFSTTPCEDGATHRHSSTATPRSVIWIDTVNGPHTCADIYRQLAPYAPSHEALKLICLDVLGDERNNLHALIRNIEYTINDIKPALVVIDDIDHFMPFGGINTAALFCNLVRDVTNHSETSFLFIGYNNLGKKAATSGNLGKMLFLQATHVFSLSTQRDITTARLVRSYDLSNAARGISISFNIGTDNLPHEANTASHAQYAVSEETLRYVISSSLSTGDTITPQQLLTRVNAHLWHIKRQQQEQLIVDQAIKLNLLQPARDPVQVTSIQLQHHDS